MRREKKNQSAANLHIWFIVSVLFKQKLPKFARFQLLKWKICCFSLLYIKVNWISLGFGQNKQFEDDILGSGKCNGHFSSPFFDISKTKRLIKIISCWLHLQMSCSVWPTVQTPQCSVYYETKKPNIITESFG